MNFDSKKSMIKMFVCDFDGVFTDGKLTIYSDGKTSKKINYKDIMAISNLIKKGIIFAVISGEISQAIDVLKNKFPQIEVFQNIRNKYEVLEQLTIKYNLKMENVLYIGDDINDIKCLENVQIACTVNNAHDKVKFIKDIYIASVNGGEGAVREIADLIT